MNIQDKIGREAAKDFLEEYASIHKWIPEKVDVFKKTITYRFFINEKNTERDKNSAKVLFPLEFKKLIKAGIITSIEIKQFELMLSSDNEGDFIILTHVLNALRNKRIKLKKKLKSEQTTR